MCICENVIYTLLTAWQFSHLDDYKTLYNDWPYGVEKDIVHLVVWTKFKFEDDPATGDLSSQSRKVIAEYVAKEFESCMPADRVSTSPFYLCLFSFPAFYSRLHKSSMVKVEVAGDRWCVGRGWEAWENLF